MNVTWYGLRTNYRGEQVYLYRIRVPAQQARALLIDYLDEMNRLADTLSGTML